MQKTSREITTGKLLQDFFIPETFGPQIITTVTHVNSSLSRSTHLSLSSHLSFSLSTFLSLSPVSSLSLFSCVCLCLSPSLNLYLSSLFYLLPCSSLVLSLFSFTTLFFFSLALSSLSLSSQLSFRNSLTMFHCPVGSLSVYAKVCLALKKPESTGLGPFVEWQITHITQKEFEWVFLCAGDGDVPVVCLKCVVLYCVVFCVVVLLCGLWLP